MIKIRKAMPKDINSMAKIWSEMMAYHINLDHYFYRLKRNAIQSHKKYLNRNIRSKNAGFFIAEDNGKIVGYVGGWIEDRPPCYQISKNGYLAEEIVIKNCRKQGIGKRLTKKMLDWFKAKKVKFVILRTHVRNKGGIIAWKKSGFKEKLKVMFAKL